MTALLIAAQFIGVAVIAIALGVLILGAYAGVLRVHRWLVDRGWVL